MAHGENAPLNITPGAIRFNTDSMKLEYFRIGMEGGSTSSYAGIGTMAAGEWVQITTDTPDIQTGGTRGLFMGGQKDGTGVFDIIDYVNIATTGNAIDFGNLIASEQEANACSSSTRGFYFGGDPAENTIETVVISSTGNATDYGDLTLNSKTGIGMANATRGIAYLNNGNTINYFALAATGSGIDFGDATFSGGSQGMAGASSTRGVFGATYVSPAANANLDFITIATLGNGADFGDLTTAKYAGSGASNAIRAVYMNGYTGSAKTNNIEYITISTLGNSVEFGDTTAANYYTAGSASATRMVNGGGGDPVTNIIDYIQIPTTGDATDFGDLTQDRRHLEACSNGHGGLG